jgi:cytochrome c553
VKRLCALLLALLVCSFATVLEAKGNAEKGKAKAAQKMGGQQPCAECHGANGDKPTEADRPILASQYADYLIKALSDYKSGKRKSAVMNGVAADLSKQDIEDLAAWFSSQKSDKLHFQR